MRGLQGFTRIPCRITSAAGPGNSRTRARHLIKQEQDAGRLASQGGDRQSNNVVTLKDYGITKMESSRAQRLAETRENLPTSQTDIPENLRESARREKVPTKHNHSYAPV